MRCERCGGHNPTDARFCIDCGASLALATTGPTTRLAGIACPNCKTKNPEQARFCVVCGRNLMPQVAPARPVAALPARPHTASQQSYPRVDALPAPLRVDPAAQPARRTRGPAHNYQSGALVFLIGLFILVATHTIWPGILLLVGLYSLIGSTNRGQRDKGLTSIIWWGGLAFLFATGRFWPGILLLVLLSAMLGKWGQPHGRRYW
jgi:Double zinc ribbon